MFLCWEVYMSVNYIKDGAICFAILVHNVYKGINSLQNLDKIEFVQIFLSWWICFLQDKTAKMNVDKEVIWKETCMVWWAGRPDNQAKMKDSFNRYLSNTTTTALYKRSLKSTEHHYWNFGFSNSTLIKTIDLKLISVTQ